MPSTKVPKICLYCQQQFFVKRSHAPKKFYCSKACMAEGYRVRLRGTNNPHWKPEKDRRCLWCGITFHAPIAARIYCALACYKAHRAATKRQAPRVPHPRYRTQAIPVLPRAAKPPRAAVQLPLLVMQKQKRRVKTKRLCEACQRPFMPHKGKQHFCRACGYISVPCTVCSTHFRKHRTDKKATCSTACSRLWLSERQKGERSHRWQGGKTKQLTILRSSASYKAWRTAVFTRDDFTCALCRDRGGKLAAHHIYRVTDHPERIFDVDNGITLCWDCHHGIHWKEEAYIEEFTAQVQQRRSA